MAFVVLVIVVAIVIAFMCYRKLRDDNIDPFELAKIDQEARMSVSIDRQVLQLSQSTHDDEYVIGNIKIEGLIGSGSFGDVFLGRSKRHVTLRIMARTNQWRQIVCCS